MSIALYRKYRPSTFADVIGQEHETTPLSNALASEQIHHAYLFSGPRGCGKTSSARIMSRSLNCEKGRMPNPCGACKIKEYEYLELNFILPFKKQKKFKSKLNI